MNKKLTTLLLLAATPLYAVRCGGPTEAEPNGTFDEAWNNPQHPVLYPDTFLVSGFLSAEDTRDDWWILASDTPLMRMRDADVARLQSPLAIDKKPHRFADRGVSKLKFGEARFSNIKAQAQKKMRFNIESFPMVDGVPVTLEVEPMEVLRHDATLVAASNKDGVYKERELKRPDLVTLSGIVANEPDSLVFLALDPTGNTNGFIRRADQSTFISMEPTETGLVPIIFDPNRVPDELLPLASPMCEPVEVLGFEPPGGGDGDPENNPPYRKLKMALDTDFEFTQDLFGGNTTNAIGYTVTLMSAASALYYDQLNIELELSYLRLWVDSNDPFGAADTASQLYEFRAHWENSMSNVERDLAHLLSGQYGGGIAFLPGLCNPTVAYGLSRVSGYFPYPVEDFDPYNWDIYIVTHEIGHNLGTHHTHNYCPPLDQCAPAGYFGPCQTSQVCADPGTIMSYCHLCPGGMRNISLQFREEVKSTILTYLDGISCDYVATQPVTLLGGVLVEAGADISATLQRIIWADEENWYYEIVDQFNLSVPIGSASEIFNVSFEFDARDPYVYTFEGTPQAYMFSVYFE